jgi:hypothetical protein
MDTPIVSQSRSKSDRRSGFTLIFLMVLVILIMISSLATAPMVLLYTGQKVLAKETLCRELNRWGAVNLAQPPLGSFE